MVILALMSAYRDQKGAKVNCKMGEIPVSHQVRISKPENAVMGPFFALFAPKEDGFKSIVLSILCSKLFKSSPFP